MSTSPREPWSGGGVRPRAGIIEEGRGATGRTWGTASSARLRRRARHRAEAGDHGRRPGAAFPGIGDSVLGRRVNLGRGPPSNFKNDGSSGGPNGTERIPTGMRKFGATGDDVKTGATPLEPGTLIGPRSGSSQRCAPGSTHRSHRQAAPGDGAGGTAEPDGKRHRRRRSAAFSRNRLSGGPRPLWSGRTR